MKGRKIQFRIRPIPEREEPTSWIKEAVNDMFKHALTGLSPADKVGITFSGKSFAAERGNGWINFQDCANVKFSDIWEMIAKIFQSNSEGLSTDDFSLTTTSVKLSSGTGKVQSGKYNTFAEESNNRRRII